MPGCTPTTRSPRSSFSDQALVVRVLSGADTGRRRCAGVRRGRYFERYLRLWTEDEALGFEGIFFSEHHFARSFSPSPHLLIAALAGRTRKLRLGVMGTVLPYHHPARVVEEIGMLDHLTGGR
ncbi:MAG TPA: LLM class flavin-dependent oxidoreductase, partial [Burkholderiales bacterium]|nr:LLM class flavin-dependent oxidoreductase [Burkholderiales bacterium]